MARTFFTSDLHEGHTSILKHRPFRDNQEMRAELIRRWNSVVTDKDIVYVLGDVTFSPPKYAVEFVQRLRGHKHLVFGNHDKRMRKTPEFLTLFESTHDLVTVKVQDTEAPGGNRIVVLCHFPLLTWDRSHYGSYMLHGHSHGSLPESEHALRIDVGVDCWDFTPVSYEQIKQKMGGKSFKAVDRHGARDHATEGS